MIIFFKNKLEGSQSGIIVTDISDHYPIFLIHEVTKHLNQEEPVLRRKINADTRKVFTEKINTVDWAPVLDEPDAQLAYSRFHNTLITAFDESFPKKLHKTGYINRHNWITIGLKNSIATKHRLHTRYLRHPTLTAKAEYKVYKNKLTHILRSMERKYYQDELRKSQSNLKKSWVLIKHIINKNKNNKQKTKRFLVNGAYIEDDAGIADAFNLFFSNVGKNLDSNIPKGKKKSNCFYPKKL